MKFEKNLFEKGPKELKRELEKVINIETENTKQGDPKINKKNETDKNKAEEFQTKEKMLMSLDALGSFENKKAQKDTKRSYISKEEREGNNNKE